MKTGNILADSVSLACTNVIDTSQIGTLLPYLIAKYAFIRYEQGSSLGTGF